MMAKRKKAKLAKSCPPTTDPLASTSAPAPTITEADTKSSLPQVETIDEAPTAEEANEEVVQEEEVKGKKGKGKGKATSGKK